MWRSWGDKNAYKILAGDLKGKYELGDLGVDEKIIDKKNGYYRNRVGGCGWDTSGSRQCPLAGSREHGSEPSG
jgi:hypothetical protein